jgi:hypothetical protein
MFDLSIVLRVVRSARYDNGLGGLAEVSLRATYVGMGQMDPSMQGLTYARREFQSVTISLYSSTDNQFSGDDVLLARQNTFFSATFNPITRSLAFQVQNLALAEASYYLIARVQGMAGMEVGTAMLNNQSIQLTNALGADPFVVWTSCALNVIKSAGSYGKPGVGPTMGSRLMAMVSTAMLNTLAGFDDTVQPYRIDQNALPGANRDAALAAAAQRILSLELPGELTMINDQYNRVIQGLQSAQVSQASIEAGRAFGVSMADQIRALRAGDGSDNNTFNPTPPPGAPQGYVWTPATSGPMAGVALGPNWGSVTPWVISSPVAFQSDGLQARPDVNPTLYAEQLNEVRLYGGLNDTAQTTLLRTADQEEIALFWAYDRPNTFRPYGQLLDIAMDVASTQNTSLATNAKLLTSLSLAMADAVICAWREKYTQLQPRPWDLITGSFADEDGIEATVRDPQWRTLLSEINGIESPPFPDFMSGHSVMGGSFASVMSHFFGDGVTFTARSEELPGVVRTFDGMTYDNLPRNSFFEAGYEDAISRVYGGVHIREACLDSFVVGRNVGAAVVQTPWT